MARRPLFRTSEYPYHLTARSNNKEWFSLAMEDCWEVFVKVMKTTDEKYEFKNHLFVLMSNHFHWIVSTPRGNVDEGMRYFMTETSRAIARSLGRINKIYGQRYHWSVLHQQIHYAEAFRYVYLNPSRARIVRSAQEYPWNSAREKRIKTYDCLALDSLVPKDPVQFTDWLEDIDEQKSERVKSALRRKFFELPRDRLTKRK